MTYTPLTGCKPPACRFRYRYQSGGVVKYTWDFNDGNTLVTTVPKASHIYTNPGHAEMPQVTLTDAAGCTVSGGGNGRIIIVQGSIAGILEVQPRLAVPVGHRPFYGFHQNSIGTITKYNWFFWRRGYLHFTKSFLFLTAAPGLYSVKLKVTTAGFRLPGFAYPNLPGKSICQPGNRYYGRQFRMRSGYPASAGCDSATRYTGLFMGMGFF